MGIHKKLLEIMNETEAIEKKLEVGTGKNSYKAIGEAEVLNMIKPLLKKYGVVLFPVKVEAKEMVDSFTTSRTDYKTNEIISVDSSRLMTQIIASYKIVDVESGEFEILQTIGNGVDTQDKASGKAMTYAYKSLLQKTFCLFSGEDTDKEHSDDITERQSKLQKKTATVTEAQLKRLYAIARTNGFTADQVKAAVQKDYDRKPEEMDTVMYIGLINRLEKAGAKQ